MHYTMYILKICIEKNYAYCYNIDKWNDSNKYLWCINNIYTDICMIGVLYYFIWYKIYYCHESLWEKEMIINDKGDEKNE